jgi:MFS family permease
MPARRARAFGLTLVAFATFTDMVAYSVAVPVLPDLARKLGSTPTVIGLLFASFAVTLLTVSIPMGAVSDRVGRRWPLFAGLVVLAAATLLFAFARGLPGLFAARLAQGAADAVTWVVGFALLADLYEPSERGRVSGIVMGGTGFALMIGPSLGGWFYELGGIRLPFIIVASMAAAGAAVVPWLTLPPPEEATERLPTLTVLRTPAVGACAAAVVTMAATLSMIEPLLALQLQSLGINPGRIGIVFGAAAAASSVMHPVYGRMADRWGSRRVTMWGLALSACVLPTLGRAWSFESAVALYSVQAPVLAMAIAPSLAYMAEATSVAGAGSFGVTYGLYNVAWGVGLLGGPAIGGFLFERIGFAQLVLYWAGFVLIAVLVLTRLQSRVQQS